MILVLVAPDLGRSMPGRVVGSNKEAPNSLPPIAKADGDNDAKIIKKAIRKERVFLMGYSP